MAAQRGPASHAWQDRVATDGAEKAPRGVRHECGDIEEMPVVSVVGPVSRAAEDGDTQGMDGGLHEDLDAQGVRNMHKVEQALFLVDGYLDVNWGEHDLEKVPLEVINNNLHCVLICLGDADGSHHTRSVVAKVLDAVGVRQGARERLEEFDGDFNPAYVSVGVHAVDKEARIF